MPHIMSRPSLFLILLTLFLTLACDSKRFVETPSPGQSSESQTEALEKSPSSPGVNQHVGSKGEDLTRKQELIDYSEDLEEDLVVIGWDNAVDAFESLFAILASMKERSERSRVYVIEYFEEQAKREREVILSELQKDETLRDKSFPRNDVIDEAVKRLLGAYHVLDQILMSLKLFLISDVVPEIVSRRHQQLAEGINLVKDHYLAVQESLEFKYIEGATIDVTSTLILRLQENLGSLIVDGEKREHVYWTLDVIDEEVDQLAYERDLYGIETEAPLDDLTDDVSLESLYPSLKIWKDAGGTDVSSVREKAKALVTTMKGWQDWKETTRIMANIHYSDQMQSDEEHQDVLIERAFASMMLYRVIYKILTERFVQE